MKSLRLAAALLFALPLAAQEPTLFERGRARVEKNPALGQKVDRGAEIMKRVSFMAGRFEVTERTFSKGMTPDPPKTGIRESKFDLDGKCLITRQTVGAMKTVDVLVFDPYQEYWFRQIVTNFGRGALQPLSSTSGWDNGQLVMNGQLWAFGEKAEVRLRIQKVSEDSYTEVWEEKFAGMNRPLIESTFKRMPAAK